VGFTTDRAELAFEWTHPEVRWMAELPAAVALWNTYVFHSGENGETMFSIHEQSVNKVLHLKTHVRVLDIEPECPLV